VYIGDAVHKGTAYPGEHEAIISLDLWNRVHGIMKESPRVRARRTSTTEPALLKRADLRTGRRCHVAHIHAQGRAALSLLREPVGLEARSRDLPDPGALPPPKSKQRSSTSFAACSHDEVSLLVSGRAHRGFDGDRETEGRSTCSRLWSCARAQGWA
jgi:hypothetical protein